LEGRSYSEVRDDLSLATTDAVTFLSVTTGDTILGDHGIVLDPIPDANGEWCGVYCTMTVDSNSTGFGAALFLATDGHLDEADADAASTMPCRFLALETGTGSKKVLVQGFIRNTSWSWNVGYLMYVSTGTGVIDDAQPSGSGDQVQCIGIAIASDTILFDPSPLLIELA